MFYNVFNKNYTLLLTLGSKMFHFCLRVSKNVGRASKNGNYRPTEPAKCFIKKSLLLSPAMVWSMVSSLCVCSEAKRIKLASL